MSTKQKAMEKWPREAVGNREQRVENFLKTFPTVERLREFWEDTKNLSWPETYGSSPWEFAGTVAYHVFNSKGVHQVKGLAEKLGAYSAGDRQDHALACHYRDLIRAVRALEVHMIVDEDRHGIFDLAVFRALGDGFQQGDVPITLPSGIRVERVQYVPFTHKGMFFEPAPFFAVLHPTGNNLLAAELLIYAGSYPSDVDASPIKSYSMRQLLPGTTAEPDLRELARLFRYENSCGGYQWGVTRGPDGGYGAETLTQLVLMGYAEKTGNNTPNQLGGVWPEVRVTLAGIRAVIESGVLLQMQNQNPGPVAHARGTWGEFEFDALTGAVLGPMYGEGITHPELDIDKSPIRIDVEELQTTYPDEDIAGRSYDVLDLGFMTADGKKAEPVEDWREEFRQEVRRARI